MPCSMSDTFTPLTATIISSGNIPDSFAEPPSSHSSIRSFPLSFKFIKTPMEPLV